VELGRALELLGGNVLVQADLGHLFAISGKRDRAREVIENLRNLSERRYVPAFHIALVLVGLGETDQALEWLEKAYQERSDLLVYLRVDPRLDPLRGDPRFADLLRRVGLT